MSEKAKFPAPLAADVATKIISELAPSCERICFAGSLRRRKSEVGDIEILYIPKTAIVTEQHLFGEPANLTNRAIAALETIGLLSRRKNIKGNEAFGDRIKLMIHPASGIPVDLFSTTTEAWHNYLVCRTGGAASNTRIASLARSRGYKWEPYSAGFVDPSDGRVFAMPSERDVFRFVGLDYEEPWERP
jgi:DNA polymerase/3'-5' exonuclease PolX